VRKNPEWCNSPLHNFYLSFIDASGGARSPAAAAIAASHKELRALLFHAAVTSASSSSIGSTGKGGPRQAIAQCRWLTAPLCEELQLSLEAAVPALSSTAGKDVNISDEEVTYQWHLCLEGCRALLAYRDAAINVIHHLVEHETIVQRCGSETSSMMSASASAVVLAVEAWQKWCPDKVKDNTDIPFLWRGANALDAIGGWSLDLKDSNPQVSTPPLSAPPLLPEQLQRTFGPFIDGQARLQSPQNSTIRASLKCARGLRSLLRSQFPGSAGSSTCQSGSLARMTSSSSSISSTRHAALRWPPVRGLE
jgi:hypothetical protein